MQVLTPPNPHRLTILGQAVAIVGLVSGLVSCGGGGGGGSGGGSAAYTTSTTYTVSGIVSGLSGTGLVLQNNAADDKIQPDLHCQKR
jgi:6-phosphogluconolactonase